LQPDEFIERYVNLALEAQAFTQIDYRVILAQWAHETGWGGSELATKHNNLGCIKYVGKGGVRGPNGFASYATAREFLRDYIRVMSLDFYRAVRSAPTPDAQIYALQASPYDENHYPHLRRVYDDRLAALNPA